MAYIFAPQQQPTLAIEGDSALFPVRRIFCVGRNYSDHVREMGGDAKTPPVFFSKPADAIIANGAAIPFPAHTSNLHHEIELVLAIGKAGARIDASAAREYIFGYATGCDLTRRDRQGEAKQNGEPWDTAKGFDHSAPIAPIKPANVSGHIDRGRIWCAVNGAMRQDADLSTMIWSVPEIVAHVSSWWDLKAGDLIFTGTPAGVGKLEPGDVVTGGIEGLSDLNFRLDAA